MKERTKDVFTSVMLFAIGGCLGALIVTLLGCGAGPGYLLSGLVADSIIDAWRPEDEAEDGLDCYDLNANGECDEEEDWTGPEGEPDAVCDVYDCRGSDGDDGADGEAGVPGPTGPHGEPGETTVIVIEVPVGHHGNAWGSDGPNGNQEKP